MEEKTRVEKLGVGGEPPLRPLVPERDYCARAARRAIDAGTMDVGSAGDEYGGRL